MFKEGNILYFNPFYFENGNTPKPKYFLVLKEVDGQLLLASLPTSHDHIPSNKIGFVSPARRYEAPTVVLPPQM